MAISGGDGSITLTTKVDESGLNSGLSNLKSGIGAFGKSLAVAGAAGAAAFASAGVAAIKLGADFEQSAAKASTLFGSVAVDTDNLNKKMLGLSSSTGVAATELNEALYSALSAGIPATENMSEAIGILEGSTKLAKAGFTDVDTALSATAKTLNAYGLDTTEAERIQGILIQTQNKGITTVGELGASLAQVTPTAAAFNVSFENVGAALATMTAQGTPTAQATTQLNSLIAELGKQGTTASNNLMKAAEGTQYAGMSFSEMTASGASLGDILSLIAKEAEKNDVSMVDMFSSIEAGKAALSIASGESQTFNSNLEAMTNTSGLVDEAYGKVTNTLSSQTSILIESFKNLGTAIGTGGNVDAAIQNLITSFGNFTSVALPVVQTVIQGILQAIQGLLPQIPVLFNQMLPIVIQGVSAIISGLVAVLPQIVNAVINILPQLLTAILNMLPQILSAGIQILLSLIQGLTQALPQLIAMLPQIINTIITVLIENLPLIINAGIQLLIAIITGLSEAIPQLMGYIPTIINTLITVLIENLPLIINSGIELLVALINGLIQALPQLVAMIPQIIWTIVTTLIENLPQLLEAGETLLTSIIDGIKSVLSTIGEVGKDIVDGLWNGIQGAKDWLLGKIDEWCGSVLDGIKGFFGIHSPSRVMRDEVGKMIPKGMAIGIDKAKNLVTKATKSLVTDTRSEVQKVLDNMNEEMLESEKFYADESLRIQQEKEEKEYQEKINAAQNEEERQKIELEKAEKLQEEANKKYLDGLKETADKERKIYEARQKDIKNAQNNIVDAYEDAANNILDSIKDLQQKQEALANKFKDFGSVMEDVTEIEDKFNDVHSPLTEEDGRYKLSNLQIQTKQLEKYSDLMLGLRDREGMSLELFDMIKNMSFEESFEYAKKLMRMSDNQFSNYIENWQKKQETSKRITQELFGDDGSMGAKRILSDLTEQTNVLKDYYSLLEQVKNRAELPEGFFDTLRDMGIEEGLEYANALLELSDEDFTNYINAWEEKQKTSQLISKELYKDEAEQLATEIGDKFDEVEKEFFGVGENAADQFESGFLEQLKTVVSIIKGTISGAFLGITPDANYGIDDYSIDVPALARGSVLPGGKPFLAIVNDQPRGQTNVEAPLQTIVDAMNIALNNRSGVEVIREEHYNLNETELMTILHKLVKGGERLQGKSLIAGGAY